MYTPSKVYIFTPIHNVNFYILGSLSMEATNRKLKDNDNAKNLPGWILYKDRKFCRYINTITNHSYYITHTPLVSSKPNIIFS